MKQISISSMLLGFLERQSRSTIFAIAIFLVIGLGGIDYWTGYSASFGIFYLLPVTLAAWRLSFSSAAFFSLTCAILWLIVNHWTVNSSLPSVIAYWNALTRLGFFLIVSALIADVRRLLQQQITLARTDALTRALNRRAFYEVLETELLRARRYQLPFTLVCLDLDNFKIVNDQSGHGVGDEVLCTVAAEFQNNIRNTDSFARLGGDEFALLLVGTNETLARSVLPRIRLALLNQMSANHWPITFSMGVLVYQGGQTSLTQLLQEADQLMYQSKQAGKNQITFALCAD